MDITLHSEVTTYCKLLNINLIPNNISMDYVGT